MTVAAIGDLHVTEGSVAPYRDRLAEISRVADVLVLPKVSSFVAPILATIPVQLLAYHTATFMGTDVDQPRNLAKSVTVE